MKQLLGVENGNLCCSAESALCLRSLLLFLCLCFRLFLFTVLCRSRLCEAVCWLWFESGFRKVPKRQVVAGGLRKQLWLNPSQLVAVVGRLSEWYGSLCCHQMEQWTLEDDEGSESHQASW